jgi:hypothetical protein
MDFSEYEVELVSRARLAELRAAAARHVLVAQLARQTAGAGVRARLGRGLVRLGVLVEGRHHTSPAPARLAAR